MRIWLAVCCVLLASASGGCSGSEFQVSSAARPKAEKLLTTIETDLARTCTVNPEGRDFDRMVARARAELAELRAVAETRADRAVMLLLARVLMRDRERCTLIQIEGEGGDETIAQFLAQRKGCAAELVPWLEGRGEQELLQTPCLAAAEQDAQTLLLK